MERSKRMVERHLADMKGADRGQLVAIEAETLKRTMDDTDFFALRFRRFPIEVVPEPPLQPNNIFVALGEKVIHVADKEALKRFLKKHLKPARDVKSIVAATDSCLRLFQEIHHDGFFEFEAPSVKATDQTSEGEVKVVKQRGDKGELTVKLRIDQGKVIELEFGGQPIPGIRPKCQAARLLDPDPVIREIMRRDILVMGRACQPYLDEVRAAADPELRNAIDAVWQQILDEDR